jgi:hypothetical protein
VQNLVELSLASPQTTISTDTTDDPYFADLSDSDNVSFNPDQNGVDLAFQTAVDRKLIGAIRTFRHLYLISHVAEFMLSSLPLQPSYQKTEGALVKALAQNRVEVMHAILTSPFVLTDGAYKEAIATASMCKQTESLQALLDVADKYTNDPKTFHDAMVHAVAADNDSAVKLLAAHLRKNKLKNRRAGFSRGW